MTDTTTTLYRFYDASDRLLYIGIAGNPGRRFNEHGKDKQWWDQVARSTMEHHPSRQAALHAEEQAIKDERPIHNVVHNTADHRSSTTAFRCTWVCFGCHSPIDDGAGHIEIQRGQPIWHAWHKACDPDLTSDPYWIAVERIRTRAELKEWTRHLGDKRWIDDTNWWAVEACQFARIGYSPQALKRAMAPVS